MIITNNFSRRYPYLCLINLIKNSINNMLIYLCVGPFFILSYILFVFFVYPCSNLIFLLHLKIVKRLVHLQKLSICFLMYFGFLAICHSLISFLCPCHQHQLLKRLCKSLIVFLRPFPRVSALAPVRAKPMSTGHRAPFQMILMRTSPCFLI